jgi:hypothetical protein
MAGEIGQEAQTGGCTYAQQQILKPVAQLEAWILRTNELQQLGPAPSRVAVPCDKPVH